MAKLQDLYLGKCLQDLKHHFEVGNIMKNKPEQLNNLLFNFFPKIF